MPFQDRPYKDVDGNTRSLLKRYKEITGIEDVGDIDNQMAMLIAILEKRAGYFFSNMDCYLNIVGGLRADEPASDLAAAVALISSLKDAIIDSETIVFGEIGLAGEIRMVNNCEQRIKESERLGFKRCIIPRQNMKKLNKASFTDIEVIGVRNVREAFEIAIENA